MALKLGTGDVVCMVDADNYAGPGYAQWIDSVFSSHGSDTIITTLRKEAIPFRDQGGKFCLGRKLFHEVGGLDENLVGYGMEDTDLINRMENAGGKRVYIEDRRYLRFIEHSDEERLRHFKFTDNVGKLYIRIFQSDSAITQLLYLFKDNSFSEMRYRFDESLKHNQVRSFHGWVLEENGQRKGVCRRLNGDITFTFNNGEITSYKNERTGILNSVDPTRQTTWEEVTAGDELYLTYIMAYTECLNRRRYVDNDKKKHTVNPNGWGTGIVCRNFNEADSFRVL
jgi:hypothetical protein